MQDICIATETFIRKPFPCFLHVRSFNNLDRTPRKFELEFASLAKRVNLFLIKVSFCLLFFGKYQSNPIVGQ